METTAIAQSSKIIQSTQLMLKLTFGIVPIVAGLDKFTNILAQWDAYLNPSIASALPFSAATFMMIVGVIEILAGILVLWKPAIGALVVMAWLILIALTLLLSGRYLDVAVRDLVMAIGAYTLMRLTKVTEGSEAGSLR